MKFFEIFEICFEILEKVQSGTTRLIPSMAEINECFLEVNTCFSKSIHDFSSQYVFLRKTM